jgi:pyrroloquinoline quinone biosynthesis protein D
VRVSATTRPRLVRRARLRDDPRRGTVLLAPEEVYVLNGSAAAVLRLCDGRDVASVVSALDAGDVVGDVIPFLQALADRGLLEEP